MLTVEIYANRQYPIVCMPLAVRSAHLHSKPKDLSACVSEERGDGEGAGSQALSLT
jgi:hypothetical protein